MNFIVEKIWRFAFCKQKIYIARGKSSSQTPESLNMSDSDSFEDDDILDELLEKTGAVNRQINETVIRHVRPVQRTLTGERLENEDDRPTRYEEIIQNINYLPTHHEMNKEALNSYIYPSNFEVRDYQYDIIQKALFKNLLCAIPTGMGKTFIASTVMLNYYRWFKKGKIIFMAPTRPLVAQQIQACLGVTDISSDETAILLDKSRKNRPEIWNNKRVFFTTPQVVENDLKSGILDPKEIVCLVIDEAHRARGNYAYTNVVQFIDRFNTSFRVLALTATPAADIEGVQEVVENLHISTIEIRTEESFDIVKYMKRKETFRIRCDMNTEMYDIVDLLGEAILPVLKKANEANIYDITDPARINHFQALQKSQAIVRNPSIPEGTKWNYYFILQVIGYVGQMIRRLKIYGVRTFFSYFENKCKEFRTKWTLGKSTNKIAQGFYYHQNLTKIEEICKKLIADKSYISHPKLEHLIEELTGFFEDNKESRVIIFTELRESALEIVKCVDENMGNKCKPHIFIGQARGKEGFNENEYVKKHGKKGRGKHQRAEREEKEKQEEEQRQKEKEESANQRLNSRTGTSEEAQIQGMNQKTQKELIKKFKKGDINVLVATSIGEEGLDIGEVDLIICYDSTSSPIKNIQRMGRTGRKRDGKVILLLSGSEESKFEQSMEEYGSVQKKIASNALDMKRSDRIIPHDIKPNCVKKLIEIPEDNLIIARGEDEDQVIKYATQAMLGKNLAKGKGKGKAASKAKAKGKSTIEQPPPKVAKRFFMPINAQTGFVNSSSLVRKIGEPSSANPSKSDTSKNASVSLISDDEDEDASNTSAPRMVDTSFHLSNLFSTPNKSSGPSSSRDMFIKPAIPKVSVSVKLPTPTPTKALVEDDDEIEIIDQNSSSPPAQKRKTFNSELPVAKQRKTLTANITKLDNIFENESESDVDDIIIKNSSERDSLDLLLFNKEKELPENEVTKEEVSVIVSQSDEEGFDDSLNTVLQEHALSRTRSELEDIAPPILDFAAFEENDGDLDEDQINSYEAPLKEAKKVMDKQYDEDLSYSFNETPNSPKVTTSKIASKSKLKSKTPVQLNGIQNPTEKSTHQLDITNLLKESYNRSRKLSSLKNKIIDLASFRESQCINLDPDSQEPTRKNNDKIYLSQRDNLYRNELDGDDGLLSEQEYNEFFTVYYTPDITIVQPDPTIAAKREVTGKIGSSSSSKRFRQFIRLCSANGEKRLIKLTSELQDPNLLNKPIEMCSIIVKDNKYKENSVDLLSDDDEDFLNL